MTFKGIIIWSRSMTYGEIASRYSECVKTDNYKTAHCLCSAWWLKHFNDAQGSHKIWCWKVAIKAYNDHKPYK